MAYDSKKENTKSILSLSQMAYPSEYVIRIFKGSYPKLDFDKADMVGKKICDLGCGDGRNIPLLVKCGFKVSGIELTEEIVKKIRENLKKEGINDVDLKAGTNSEIPYPDNHFDYLLSWNAAYYMGENRDFQKYVAEFARVMKTKGYLVLSIPKKTCFIYQGSKTVLDGYQMITNDPWGVRIGEVLRMFDDEGDIIRTFSPHFKDFVFGSIEDDCFGYNYHWHLVVCRKK